MWSGMRTCTTLTSIYPQSQRSLLEVQATREIAHSSKDWRMRPSKSLNIMHYAVRTYQPLRYIRISPFFRSHEVWGLCVGLRGVSRLTLASQQHILHIDRSGTSTRACGQVLSSLHLSLMYSYSIPYLSS